MKQQSKNSNKNQKKYILFIINILKIFLIYSVKLNAIETDVNLAKHFQTGNYI